MGSGPTQTTKQNTTGVNNQNTTTGVDTSQLQSQNSQGFTGTANQGVSQGSSSGITGGMNFGGANAWAPTLPGLQSIAGQGAQIANNAALNPAERFAMGGLQGTANYNTMLSPMFGNASGILLDPSVLSGNNAFVNKGLNYASNGADTVNSNLGGMAAGNNVNLNNPAFQSMMDSLKTDITNQVGSTFAASGRPLGTNTAGTYALGRGMMAGMAPTALDWINNRTNDQINANKLIADAGFGASGAFNSGAGQINSNMGAFGSNAANAGTVLGNTYTPFNTMLTAQNYGRTAPLTTLSGVNSMLMPMASGFGQNYAMNGGYTGTNTTGVNQGSSSGLSINNQDMLNQQAVLSQLASLANTSSSGKSTTKQTSDPFGTAVGLGTTLLGFV